MELQYPFAETVGHAIGRAQRLWGQVNRDANQVAQDARAFVDSAAEARDALFDTAGATPRMARVAMAVVRLGWLYRMDRARRATTGDSSGPPSSLHRHAARSIRRLCEELRGGVLKVGQLASTRLDLLPAEWIEELAALRDQVPPVALEAITGRITEEIGPVETNFTSFDEEALAAASLAQVHGATTVGGEDVVVKVQVPGIDKAVQADLKALSLGARALADSPMLGDVPTTLTELGRAMVAELDYRREAAAQEKFRAHYAGNDRVVVPRVLEELSTARVLTMERIHGVSLDRYLESASEEMRVEVLSRLVNLVCEQVLTFGQLQADPHPGNFLVTEDGALAMLDFGCIAEFPEPVRRAFADIALAAMSGQRERMAELLVAMGFSTQDGSKEGIAAYADEVLAPFRDPNQLAAMAQDPTKQLEMAIEMARKNPVVSVPREFVLLARVFAALGGLLVAYAPQVQLGPILLRHLASNR